MEEINDRKPIKELVAIIIITTLGTFLFSYLAFLVLKNELPSSPLLLWKQWDVSNYLEIAENGYMSRGHSHLFIVFFPFYPFLIWLFNLALNDYLLSAIVISNLGYVLAAVYLYKLVLLDYPKETALKTVFYLSIFPTAYFLHAGYTESLFLALTIGSFYYARKEKWFLSGLLGLLASATRITGIILLPVLALEYLAQKEFQVRNIKKNALWLILIPLGFISYLIINYMTFDDPLKFLEIQKGHWSKTLDFPWNGLFGAWGSMWWRNPNERVLVGGAELVFGILGLLFSLWTLFRLRLSYGIYMLATWLVITSTSYWLSIPRYTLSMFPLFIALSLFGRREWVHYVITFLSILFFALFLSLFIQGRWAF